MAVIELLSPANKPRGRVGWREYLQKREEVLSSGTHLVELDLLRGGSRLPTVDPLPQGDYFVFVCRAQRRYRKRRDSCGQGQAEPPYFCHASAGQGKSVAGAPDDVRYGF